MSGGWALISLLVTAELAAVSVSQVEPSLQQLRPLVELQVKAGETRKVVRAEHAGQTHWIASAAIPSLPGEGAAQVRRRLTLLIKSAIARAATPGKSRSTVTMSGFRLAETWAESDWWMGVGLVPVANVQPVDPTSSDGSLSQTSRPGAAPPDPEPLKQEIRALEAKLATEKPSWALLRTLYERYMADADVENASKTKDQLMQMEFDEPL